MRTINDDFVLSRQERRVIELSMDGLGDKEIAQMMKISLGTVRTYWKRIVAKVGGNTRAEIVTTLARRDSAQELDRERSLILQLQAEIAQRREAEERFRAICACSPIGIYVSDAEGACSYVNPAWTRITGLPGITVMDSNWTNVVHPADRDALHEWWLSGVGKGSSAPIEFRFVTSEGEVKVRTSFSPMIVEDRVFGYVGTVERVVEPTRKRLTAKPKSRAVDRKASTPTPA